MAKLIIKQKNYGVHPFSSNFALLTTIRIFLVRAEFYPIGSLLDANHTTILGIETGNIGLKIGFNSTDMGYAIFRHVRIPRDQILMGHAKSSGKARTSS
jgi:acyl-CoA oxidase